MESLLQIGRWTLRVDREETARRYAELPVGSGCSCADCKEFESMGVHTFPEDLQQIAEQLGVDVTKPAELCHYGIDENGLYLRGGWFHAVGNIESGRDAWKATAEPSFKTTDFEKLSSGAEFGFCSNAELVAQAFKDVPLIQVEFLTRTAQSSV